MSKAIHYQQMFEYFAICSLMTSLLETNLILALYPPTTLKPKSETVKYRAKRILENPCIEDLVPMQSKTLTKDEVRSLMVAHRDDLVPSYVDRADSVMAIMQLLDMDFVVAICGPISAVALERIVSTQVFENHESGSYQFYWDGITTMYCPHPSDNI